MNVTNNINDSIFFSYTIFIYSYLLKNYFILTDTILNIKYKWNIFL